MSLRYLDVNSYVGWIAVKKADLTALEGDYYCPRLQPLGQVGCHPLEVCL